MTPMSLIPMQRVGARTVINVNQVPLSQIMNEQHEEHAEQYCKGFHDDSLHHPSTIISQQRSHTQSSLSWPFRWHRMPHSTHPTTALSSTSLLEQHKSKCLLHERNQCARSQLTNQQTTGTTRARTDLRGNHIRRTRDENASSTTAHHLTPSARFGFSNNSPKRNMVQPCFL